MNYTRADIINALCAEWDYLCHDDFDPDRALVNYNVIDGDVLILKEV